MAAGALSGQEQKVLQHLEQFLTARKRQKVQHVLASRTRHLTLVLEDIHNAHNASAVLRTCECYGVQDVHIIAHQNAFTPSIRVSRGSFRWTDLYNHQGAGEEGTHACISQLKEQGYKIVATTPHAEAYTPDSLPVDKKVALLFGKEITGLSQAALAEADMHLSIPMYGFTESLNLSVSAAILLNKLVPRLHQSDLSWRLTQQEQDQIKLKWYKTMIKHANQIEKEFLKACESSLGEGQS